MPFGMNAPKLWPAEPLKWSWMVSSGRPCGAVLLRDLAAGDGADHAIDVADRQLGRDLLAALDRRLAEVEQRGDVERLLEAVILRRSGRKRPTSGPTSGWYRMLLKSKPLAFQ